MCARVVQLPARKAFSLWLCPGLDCPRGLENLHNWRLLTKRDKCHSGVRQRWLILPHTDSCIPQLSGELLPQGSLSRPQGCLENGKTPAQVEQFAQNIRGYYTHVLSPPAPALGFICSLLFQVPQVRALCSGCTPGSPPAQGSSAHLGPSVGKSSQEERLGCSRLAGSRAGHGRSWLWVQSAWGRTRSLFQAHPGAAVPWVARQGCTSWERENHLAEEFHIEATGKLFYILQPQHW